MIDIEHEKMMTFYDAIAWLGSACGRRFSRSAVYTWASRGVSGRVLETVKIGGRKFTSVEALVRFAGHFGGPKSLGASSVAQRNRRAAEAARRAEEVFG